MPGAAFVGLVLRFLGGLWFFGLSVVRAPAFPAVLRFVALFSFSSMTLQATRLKSGMLLLTSPEGRLYGGN